MHQLFNTEDAEKVFLELPNHLQEKGFAVMPDALPRALVDALLHSAQQQGDFIEAGIGRGGDEQKNAQIRRDKIAWIDADSPVNTAWLSWCEEFKCYLNRELFLGVCDYESHYAYYQQGDFYKRHLDAFRHSGQAMTYKRVVSMVTYLNRDWPSNSGGELILYDLDNQMLEKVVPNAGTIVVFLSEEFPHEVLAAKQDRFSIATWFRRKL